MPDSPYYSINKFPGDGTTTSREINFAGGYISQDHVKSYFQNNVTLARVDAPFVFTAPNTILSARAATADETLVMYRDTPKDTPIANFVSGSILTEISLDTNAKQAVFIAAESIDQTANQAVDLASTFAAIIDDKFAALVLNSPLTQIATGAFWTGWNSVSTGLTAPTHLGARVQRINDRLFVGGATVSSGDFPASNKDWLEQFEAARSSPFGFRTSWAQFASLATNGGIAVLGAARTSDANLTTLQLSMGGCFTAVNDNVVNQQLATALYAVAFRRPGAGSILYTGTTGGEIDIVNEGDVVQVVPGNLFQLKFTVALQLNSGGISPYATTASHALGVGNNGATFNAGVVIGQNAINGLTYDGAGKATGGGGSAIRLGAFHQIEWWNNDGSAPTSLIASKQLLPANAQSIIFTDSGITFGGAYGTGLAFTTLYPTGATGAYLAVTPAYGSNPATFSVEGPTNADLMLKPKGLGGLRVPIANIVNAANDAAAAASGLSIGQFYRNGSVLMIRVS